MMTLPGYLAEMLHGNSYHADSRLLIVGNRMRKSGRLHGMKRSIYHRWGFDNDAYHTHLSKAQRKGKSWEETQALRREIARTGR